MKLNILLDLDNTLISSLSEEEECPTLKPRMKHFRWENMDGYYKVFERPGLQPFLDYLFKHFNVSVWTAASKSYALFIIEKFVLNGRPERQLDYIFFSHHCKHSKKRKATQKSLSLLSTDFKLANYNTSNTYIIDDHPEVFEAQPNNCISVKAFEFTNRKSWEDDELSLKVMPLLERLRPTSQRHKCFH